MSAIFKPDDFDFTHTSNGKGDTMERNNVAEKKVLVIPLLSSKLNRLYKHLNSGVPIAFVNDAKEKDRSIYADYRVGGRKNFFKEYPNLKNKTIADDIMEAGVSINKLPICTGSSSHKSDIVFNKNTLMVIGYRFKGTKYEEIMDLEEFTKLTTTLCNEYEQPMIIVGRFNKDTKLCNFVMYNYTYDASPFNTRVTSTTVTNFNDVKFVTERKKHIEKGECMK